MSKFLVEKSASMALGNTCAGCSTHKCDEGFVNTNLDVLGRGRIYFCARCVWEMGRNVGCFDPQQVARLEGVCEEVQDGAETLRRELERTKASMVVPLAEVIDFVAAKHAKEQREAAASKPKASA